MRAPARNMPVSYTHLVLKASRKLADQGLCHPTFFEFLFYMAMVLFRMHDVDVMILETGMGGRLDTTNVLERPAACVITSISMDHTRYLGDTLAKIAGEKAGIIKTGVPLIFDDGQPEVSTIPVSYTHLDVYKRQSYKPSERAVHWLKGGPGRV